MLCASQAIPICTLLYTKNIVLTFFKRIILKIKQSCTFGCLTESFRQLNAIQYYYVLFKVLLILLTTTFIINSN